MLFAKSRMVSNIALLSMLACISSLNVQAYDGKAAANYATTYAQNNNTGSYPSFGSDCTNFVSQCVYAGGISKEKIPDNKITYYDIDDIYKTKDYWSCDEYTRTISVAGITILKKTGYVTTSTWSVVAKKDKDSWWGFYNYMKDRGASANEYAVDTVSKLDTFISNCDVGDILQIRDASDNTKHHSVVVTDKSYDSANKRYDMKIAYHTTNTPPTDFRSVSWQKFGKAALWTVVKVSKI